MTNKKNLKKINVSSTNPLPVQKHAIGESLLYYLGAVVLFLVLSIMTLCIWFSDKGNVPEPPVIYLFSAMYPALFLLCCIAFIRRFNIFCKIRKIKYSNEKPVSINCRKVLCMLHPSGKYSSKILGMILKDDTGNKFYYIYPDESAPPDVLKKDIKKQYTGTVAMTCYRGTNIIKKLPDRTE